MRRSGIGVLLLVLAASGVVALMVPRWAPDPLGGVGNDARRHGIPTSAEASEKAIGEPARERVLAPDGRRCELLCNYVARWDRECGIEVLLRSPKGDPRLRVAGDWVRLSRQSVPSNEPTLLELQMTRDVPLEWDLWIGVHALDGSMEPFVGRLGRVAEVLEKGRQGRLQLDMANGKSAGYVREIRVLTVDAEPVEGVVIAPDVQWNWLDGEGRHVVRGVSDERGRLVLSHPVSCPTRFVAEGHDWAVVAGHDRLGCDVGDPIRVRPALFVAGTLVGAAGRELARQRLVVRDLRGRVVATATTSKSGDFSCIVDVGNREAVDVCLQLPLSNEVEVVGGAIPVPQGGLILQSNSLHLVDVQALCEGAPVTDYGVRVVPRNSVSGGGIVEDIGRHPEGLCTVVVPVSGASVQVVPTDPQWMPSRLQLLEGRVSPAGRVAVEMARAVPLHVRVEAGSGQPMSGVRVELVEVDEVEYWPDRCVGLLSQLSPDVDRGNVVVSAGKIYGEGQVMLRQRAMRAELGVRVLIDGRVAAAERFLGTGKEGYCVVRLPLGGSLRAVVEGGGEEQWEIALACGRHRARKRLDFRGAAVFEDLVPGEYSVVARRQDGLAVYLGRVGVARGHRTDAAFAIPEIDRYAVDLVGWKPVARPAVAYLWGKGSGGRMRAGTTRLPALAAELDFEAPAGEYWLELVEDLGSAQRSWYSVKPVRLGEGVRLHVAIGRVQATVGLLHDGQFPTTWTSEDFGNVFTAQAEQGQVVLTDVPPGEYSVDAGARGAFRCVLTAGKVERVQAVRVR